ncbi:hypothetical protein BX616_005710, partial [Lobosporangium transversale]
MPIHKAGVDTKSSGTDNAAQKHLYAWQLLPDEELQRISYNSRKQQQKRLMENPPKCPTCPNARFTSIAMLTTHLSSKKHLARVKQLHKDQTSVSTVDPSNKFSKPTSALLKPEKNNPIEEVEVSRRQGAKQRRRQLERAIKKARSRKQRLADSGDAGLKMNWISNEKTQDKNKNDRPSKQTSITHISAPRLLNQTDISIAAASQTQSSCTKNAGQRAMPSTLLNETSINATQAHWYCSVCGSRWNRWKAWLGHLLSAQHLRHVLRTMKQVALPIAPYRRIDVAASKDVFGWGTGAGIVEEEEVEDEGE